MNIALALSGGGVRAAVFHLGVMARLASEKMLEHVTFISTVSGGSMVVGLVYALSDNRWPSSRTFLEDGLPAARLRLTRTSIQRDYVKRLFRRPRTLECMEHLRGNHHWSGALIEPAQLAVTAEATEGALRSCE